MQVVARILAGAGEQLDGEQRSSEKEGSDGAFDSDREPVAWSEELNRAVVRWDDFEVVLSSLESRVRLQLWSESASGPLGRPALKLLCQTLISPVDKCRHNDFWFYCYGGATEPTRMEDARQMVLGVLRPPSTYCCTVGIRMTTAAAHVPKWNEFADREKVTLVARLYHGLYLSELEDKQVTVFVEVPGTPEIGHSSRVRLAFPGRVSSTGVLQFDAPQAEEGGWSLFSRRGSEAAGCVERASVPFQAHCVRTRGGLQRVLAHAYVYIVEVGKESAPPRIFGRLRLGASESLEDRPADGALRWRRLRYDSSVRSPPTGHLGRELAGCLLGHAYLVTGKVEFGPDWRQDGDRHEPGVFSCSSGQRRSPTRHRVRSPERPLGCKLLYHVDVLVARDLPPASEEGLCKACYSVCVGDKVKVADGDIPVSLNPTYWHRAAVSLDLDSRETPPPPLLIRMYNQEASGGGGAELGNVLVKRPRKIAAEDPEMSSQELLDVEHRAFWHSLSSGGVSQFAPSGSDSSELRMQPRLLAAIAYSEAAGPDVDVMSIPVNESASFRVEVSLLGLRGLPASMKNPQLQILPFAGQERSARECKLNAEMQSVNPNFHHQGISDAIALGALGAHLQGCIRKVPIIPYLQSERTSESTVLLPDLVLRLQDSSKDWDGKHGALSLPLQCPDGGCDGLVPPRTSILDEKQTLTESVFLSLNVAGQNPDTVLSRARPTSLFCKLSPPKKSLPDSDHDRVQSVDRLAAPWQSGHVELDHETYEMFVDVFAAEAGELLWNEVFSIGRSMNEQRLFDITLPNGEDGPTQMFNASDNLLNGDEVFSAPFETRVSPVLRCARWLDSQKRWLSSRGDRRSDDWPQNLFKDCVNLGYSPLRSSLEPNEFKTRKLCTELRFLYGCRCMSHLTAPEKLNKASPKIKEHLDLNLQTFMRPRGHRIKRNDGHSRYLARLWVTSASANCKYKIISKAPERPLKKLAKQASRSLSEFHDFIGGERNLEEDIESESGLAYLSPEDGEMKLIPGERAPWGAAVLGVDDPDRDDDKGNRYLRVEENKYLPIRLNGRTLLEFEGCPHDGTTCPTRPHPHFLMIKFKKPGKIVWAPPETDCQWQGAGQVLFVVQLDDHPDTFVQVVVPSFDVRFPMESAWYVRKTLLKHWRMVDQEAFASKMTRSAEHHKAHHGHRRRSKSDKEAKSEEDEHDAMLCCQKANGYTLAIPVSKNAFVCRIVRRPDGQCYDRPQTWNWFREVLLDAFPQISLLPSLSPGEDRNAVKEVFMRQCMNLRHCLTRGDSHHEEELCRIKGHVRVQKLVRGEDSGDSGFTQPTALMPWQLQWRQSDLTIYMYVLTAAGLPTVDQGSQVYLVATVPGSGVSSQVDIRLVSEPVECCAHGTAFFYHVFKIKKLSLPGPCALQIQVWKKQVAFRDTQLAYAEFELEDRWQALNQRRSRIAGAGPDGRAQVRADESDSEISDRSPSKSSFRQPLNLVQDAAARRADAKAWGLHQQPLECRELLQPGARELDGVGQVGALRVWMDVFPEMEQRKEHDLRHKSASMEVRVVIKNVTGITVFKDWAQRNDVKVRGVFKCRNVLNQPMTTSVTETDVHHWARDKACFNWRWVKKVKAPLTMFSLNLSLIDVDFLGEELIYKEEDLPLDNDLQQALEYGQAVKRHVDVFFGSAAEERLTDWSDIFPCLKWIENCQAWWQQKIPRWCCCASRSDASEVARPARLSLYLEVLPAEVAELNPVESGNVEPAPGRMGWSMAVEEPADFMKTMCGPTVYRNTIRIGICTLCALVTLFVLVFVFLLRETLLPFSA